jgi:hypothetical protein
MGNSGRAVLVAAAGAFLASAALAQPYRRAHITVVDHLSAGQQEETIAVYLGGVIAGTLHIDSEHPDDSFTADVPAMPRLPFALCGKLLRADEDGAVTIHPIDNGGTLTDFDGGSWAAITLGDVMFTLRDESGKGDSTVNPGPACSAAVS